MNVDTGVRIAIMVPSVLFLIMVLWHYYFHESLLQKLIKLDPTNAQAFRSLTTSHFFQLAFVEAFILFLVNGVIISLEIQQTPGGIVFLIGGLLLVISGLILAIGEQERRNHLVAFFSLVISFACGQLVFLGTCSQGTEWLVVGIPLSWLLFTLVFISVGLTFYHYVQRRSSNTIPNTGSNER